MTKRNTWVGGLALLAALAFLGAGCDNPARTGPGGKPPAAGKGPKAEDKGKKGDEHAHPTEGPHHGALAEWGDEEYHAEFTVDHKGKKATVYILDGTARKAAPIAAD